MATISLAGVGNTNINQVGTLTTGTWQATPVTEVYGGTGQSSYTQGDLLYASAANTLSKLAKNTTATRYLSNTGTSNNPAWAQVNLANGVTGTNPVGNGGTGNTTFTAYSIICAGTTSTGAFQNVSGLGSAGEVLTSNGAGALPTWGTAPSGLAASQAQMEAATATNVYSSPGRQQYHPAHPKAWVKFNGTGTVAIDQSFGVSSITDNATGAYQINYSTNFSSIEYGINCAASDTGGSRIVLPWGTDVGAGNWGYSAPLVGSTKIGTVTYPGIFGDSSDVSFMAFGDQ